MLNAVRRCWDELLGLLWRAIWRIRCRRAVTRHDTPVSDDRIIRLFVSSTFRDMHDERATLQRAVFPAVRRALRARGVQFIEVDLRWGVTREEVERGDVISICLQEIDRCRPWILGLFGGYYGYIDQEASRRIAADPALARLEPFHRESLTALELRHAITHRPACAPDPAALIYWRPATSTPSPYSDLGRELAHCGVAVRDTPPDLEGFAAAVRKDLIDLVVGRLDGRVVEAHEVLARGLLLEGRAAFVDRPELSLLLRLVLRGRRLVAVVGPEGVGKSALIAALGRAVQEARLMHLVPVLVPGGFRNWIGAFKTAMAILGQSSLVPAAGPGDLARSFHMAAEAVAAVEPLCVLFDDIDTASVESAEAQLAWLPRCIRDVTIVVALRGGDAVAEHATNLGYDVIRLGVPDRRLAATMVEQRLLAHGRRLSEHQTAQLTARPRSARGHMLACEELRQVDRFEDVEGAVAELSGIETTLELGERAARRISTVECLDRSLGCLPSLQRRRSHRRIVTVASEQRPPLAPATNLGRHATRRRRRSAVGRLPRRRQVRNPGSTATIGVDRARQLPKARAAFNATRNSSARRSSAAPSTSEQRPRAKAQSRLDNGREARSGVLSRRCNGPV